MSSERVVILKKCRKDALVSLYSGEFQSKLRRNIYGIGASACKQRMTHACPSPYSSVNNQSNVMYMIKKYYGHTF